MQDQVFPLILALIYVRLS